jgi:glycosyltransferase involved in cell wall biosynthesis
MPNHLHVVDANCSWVRSLAGAMPESWTTWQYRIYSPHWLPGGPRDLLRCLRPQQLGPRLFECWVVVPGWNKFPKLSSGILRAILARRLGGRAANSILYTFPFYSHVAKALAERHPHLIQAYWAHDAFEFYEYPPGYISQHETKIIPVCAQQFAMAPLLIEDYSKRFPDTRFELLCDAVSADFLDSQTRVRATALERLANRGRPLVGCIGQINSSYDWEMLEAAATRHPATQFVFVGNLFEEGEVTSRIRTYFDRANVHWLGPVPHRELPGFIRAFDICLNPLARTKHNHRRDPLRIYDYLTSEAPVFTLNLDGVNMHKDFVTVFDSAVELVARLGKLPAPLSKDELRTRRRYIEANTWAARAELLAHRLERQFTKAV